METILAPWLERADALYGDWRDAIHGSRVDVLDTSGRGAIKLLASVEPMSMFDRLFSTETQLDDVQQRELREVLEILALAWCVDPHKCVALACEGQRGLTPLSAAPVQPNELLRITITAAMADKSPESTEFYTAFFVDWTEATASEEFKQSKTQLVELLGREPRGPRFELTFKLGLRDDSRRQALAPMNRLLGAVDRRVFRVAKITLTMKHSWFQLDQLTELFRLLHSFRGTADVRLRLQLWQDMDAGIRLCDWKPIFDLIARTQFPVAKSMDTKKKWDIEVSCGGFGLDNFPECGRNRWSVLSHARVVAACYSALANAADHVTSIHLRSPLEDKTSDYRAPVGRWERARWLGYLLRSSVVDTLTITENALSRYDLEEISAVLTAPTRDACFRRLWDKEWMRSYEDKYREYGDTKFYHVDDAEALMLLSNPDEVHGVMRGSEGDTMGSMDAPTDDGYVDVFLVGYGQCSIPRSHMALVETMKETTACRPENKAQLKSLTISSDPSLLRLLRLVGKHLEDLTVRSGRSTLDATTLVGILRACPNLRRLHLKQLELDDRAEDLDIPSGLRHPLETLQVELKLDGGASGLELLCLCLVRFGIELRELRIREPSSRHDVDDSAKRAMEKMLRSCCRSCTTIELVRFPVEYFGVIFKRDSTSWPKLETLIFEEVGWMVQTFMDLVSALSVPTHPLAQSLRTLAIGTRRFSQHGDKLLSEMLESNRRLVNFRFVTRDFRHTNMGKTNGIALERQKTRLTMPQKAAVLSALDASQLPWESFVIAKILRFAIDPEIRQMVVCIQKWRENLAAVTSKRPKPFNAAQQLQLREVLEILALAVHVDARKCVALACAGERRRSPLTSEPFGPDPWRPRLHVHASASPKLPATADFYKAFFDWTEETASEAFKQSKDALVALLGRTVEVPGPRFELVLDLKLRCRNQDFETLWLAPMIQLLQGIDRQVFRVVHITLTIKHSTFKADELTELFQLIHGFHDEADVLIRLQMCQDKRDAWDGQLTQEAWDLEVMCGGPGFDNTPDCGRDRWRVLTDARLVAACYSALAHVGDHVTSIRLINPLEDRASDYRHARDRDRRAEWLGYLLRVGAVDKLVLDEGELTTSDIREIRDILRASTQDECFSMLWKLWWHRPLEKEYGYDDPTYRHIDDTARFVNDPSEVLGVMRPSSESDRANEAVANSSFVDVFLVGYGQCGIPRSLAETMTEGTTRVPERRSRLKSLSLYLSKNGLVLLHSSAYDRPDTSLLELLSLAGENLEELAVHGSKMQLPLSFLVRVLHLCPQLRRLDLKQLHLKPSDDQLPVRKSSARRHPLKELVLGIQLDEQSSGLRALSKWLVWFGVELRELRIRAKE